MAQDDDWLEAHEDELTVNPPADWDDDDVAALLRRAADEIDALGTVHVDRVSLSWSRQGGTRTATVTVAYRRQKRPRDVPDYAAPMAVPLRDSAGRTIGHRSRPGGTIGHSSG